VHERHDDDVADLDPFHGGADLDDLTDALVAHRRAGRWVDESAVPPEVRAAEAADHDPDDDVRRRLHRRVRHLFPANVSWPVDRRGAHVAIV
jgi:hypothetical protein